MRIVVKIPVVLGGYTGQRDAWEQMQRDFEVTLEGNDLVFSHDSPGMRVSKFIMSAHDVVKAFEFLRQNEGTNG